MPQPGLPQSAPPEANLTVATYNIQSCLGTDKRFRPDRIVEVLRHLDADIVALQEVGWALRGQKNFDQFAYLAESTGYHIEAGWVRRHANAHFGNALLSRLPLTNVEHLDLTLKMHSPRRAMLAELDWQGQPVRVVNLHLGLTPWERSRQIETILSALADRPQMPTILAGDTNGLTVSFARFQKLRDRLPGLVLGKSWHSRLPFMRYDRIYFCDNFALISQDTVMTPLTRVASDHLPLRATFGKPGQKT